MLGLAIPNVSWMNAAVTGRPARDPSSTQASWCLASESTRTPSWSKMASKAGASVGTGEVPRNLPGAGDIPGMSPRFYQARAPWTSHPHSVVSTSTGAGLGLEPDHASTPTKQDRTPAKVANGMMARTHGRYQDSRRLPGGRAALTSRTWPPPWPPTGVVRAGGRRHPASS